MNQINSSDLPLGFGMALAQNRQAMMQFARMSEAAQQQYVAQAQAVRSKQEMSALVQRIENG